MRRDGYRVAYCSQESAVNDVDGGRIGGVGFDARQEDVVTAGEVALDLVCRRHYGAPVYLLRTAALGEVACARGIRLVPEAEAEQAAVVLVARDPGFDQVQHYCSRTFAQSGRQ